MAKIEANGLSLHFQTLGEGPDVVLIHGLSGDLAFWHPAVVAGLASDHRVTRLDLRGHGYSDRPAGGYTTRDLALDVAALLERLGIARAALVGHSFGGAVALHLAALHPETVSAIVLADVRLRSLQPAHGIRDWAPWAMIRDRLAAHGIVIPDDLPDMEFGLLTELARCRVAGRLEAVRGEPFFVPFASGSVRRAAEWIDLVERTTAIADFKEIAGLTAAAIAGVRVPAFLIYGALSHCLPTRDALAAALPDVMALTVAKVGHFLPLLSHGTFLDATRAFLDDVARRGAARRAAATAGAPAEASLALGAADDGGGKVLL